MITIPDFANKKEMFDWLVENKSALIAQKKSAMKLADAVSFSVSLVNNKDEVIKSEAIPADVTKIRVKSIINTTKIMDSHDDVHIDGLWTKSITETKDNYLVNQHDFTFEGIISDNVKVSTKMIPWRELGIEAKGSTQALVYESIIDKAESPAMFERYKSGKVKQHSVGMRYVKIDMAINDPEYEKEQALWDKYFPQIVNPEVAQEKGYFFAVTEAKNIEGSAVLRGSNYVTPTQSVQPKKENEEPEKPTLDCEPSETLAKMYTELKQSIKLF